MWWSLENQKTIDLVKKQKMITASESDILKSILRLLKIHPKVAIAYRCNSGAAQMGGQRYVAFGFKGLSDIAGVLVGGRALYIEVKAKNGKASDEQKAFIEKVNFSGGLAFVARSVSDVSDELDKL
jgi:hypothetical protein